jgi:rRNA-processing protein Efg1
LNELPRIDKHAILERQKVTRKVKQTKKRLEKANSPREKKIIAAEMHELRVDLNYVLV